MQFKGKSDEVRSGFVDSIWKTFYIILPLEIFNKNIMYSAILGGL